MFTCATESLLGTYRTQAPNGPARGIFQCEGNTFNDIFTNYLGYHANLFGLIVGLFNVHPPGVDELVTNDAAAISICRVHYLRCPESLPDSGDIEGIWNYYKQFYNSPLGAAQHDTSIQHYQELVLGT